PALLSPGVVPPAALAHRDGQVALLRPGLDLAEDRVTQPGLAGRHGLGEVVLRGQVRDGLRVLLASEPRVLVDEDVAVVRPLGRYPPRRRRPGRPGSISPVAACRRAADH